MIHVLNSIISIDTDYGGSARSVTSLCKHLKNNCDINVSLISSYSESNHHNSIKESGVAFYRPQNRSYRSFLNTGQGILENEKIDIIHDSGIWLPNNLALSDLANKNKKAIIISTRGMLSRWALKYKWLKKKMAWYMYQKKILKRATVIHATSEYEADQIRNIGITTPIALIPNIIDLPDNFPRRDNCVGKNVLFLSRIHPVKGLLGLIQAWDILSPKNWTLNIAGPDENNYQEVLKNEIEKLGTSANIEFLGEINDTHKWQQYINSDIFVLPSFSENFGIVIGEALASGVPVITTKETPWRQVEGYECGWWIDLGVDALVDALKNAISMSDRQRRDKGNNGKRLIAETYNTVAICNTMASVYNWMLNHDTRPDCIIQ